MLAYALMMAGVSAMVLIAGIIGTRLAPVSGLATLPIALSVVGVATSTLPTGKLLGKFGRRPVFLAYGGIAILSSLMATASMVYSSFWGLCAAAFVMGWAGAAGHQYRFAALELVPVEDAPKATSLLLLGGILSAFIGPELAVRGKNLLSTEFAGSFLLLSVSYIIGIFFVSFYRDEVQQHSTQSGAGRPLREILGTPVVVLAISAAALGYFIMTFIMTATPISMHNHAGHSLEATKFVIQSHIVAMYLPALIYAWFFNKLSFRGMFMLGVAAYLACLGVALINTEFIHFWAALVIVGVGWNFLFLTGTNLLPHGYRTEERFRVQSLNDFLVFSMQAIASLSSGWVLYNWGWNGVLLACFPPIIVFSILLALCRMETDANGVSVSWNLPGFLQKRNTI